MSGLSGEPVPVPVQVPVLVCHDLLPSVSPVRAALRRLVDGDVPAIDGGSRMKPLGNDVLLREIGRQSGGRVFVARNAQPVRADLGTGPGTGSGTGAIRSLIALAHPVLLVLRHFEQRVAG